MANRHARSGSAIMVSRLQGTPLPFPPFPLADQSSMAKRLSVIVSQGQSSNPAKRQLEEDIAAVEEARQQKSVSLNKEARIAEREERQAGRLERENARRLAAGLEAVESFDDIEDSEKPDVLSWVSVLRFFSRNTAVGFCA